MSGKSGEEGNGVVYSGLANNKKLIKDKKHLLLIIMKKIGLKEENFKNNLREEVSSSNCDIKLLKSDIENQEQYSRRICHIAYGILVEQGEITDNTDLSVINQYFEEGQSWH